MTHYRASSHSSFAKLPGRLVVYTFWSGKHMRSGRGRTLQDAWREGCRNLGAKPDRFKFAYYAVPECTPSQS